MTLVLSYVNSFLAVQVADRRIVLAEEGLPEYDPTANKTVVYGAMDGLVTISFAGHAYLGGMPTDEWLATFLWGQPILRGPDGLKPALHSFGQRTNHWSLADTMVRLTDHMRASLKRSQGLELSVAGWRVDDAGSLVPVLYLLEKPEGSDIVGASDAVGYRDLTNYYSAFSKSGVDLPMEEADEAWRPFRERELPPTAEEAEEALVSIVQEASRAHGGVSDSVLAVCIPRFDLGTPFSRFHSRTPILKRKSIRGVEVEAEVAFVPWIVANFVTAQSYQTSSLFVPVTIQYEDESRTAEFTAHGPNASPSGFNFASTNPRPPAA